MRASSFSRGLWAVSVVCSISCFFSPACTLLDPPLGLGSPREGDELSQQASNGHESGGQEPGGSGNQAKRDTLMFVSAVCFPEDYDWQRDTAYGKVACTIKLFKGGDEVLSVPAGPGTGVGASFDGHHIIDGSLYTVYSDSGGTFVGRDGVRVSQWPMREVLCGLLYRDGVLYTLGLGFDGSLVYRSNGSEHLNVPGGVPFGGFGVNTYGPTGALYEDDGAVCFAFRRETAGGWTVCTVANGVDTDVLTLRDGTYALDAKRIGGRSLVLYNWAKRGTIESDGRSCWIPGICWRDAGLIDWEGEPAALGVCGLSSGGICGVAKEGRFRKIAGPADYLYSDGDDFVPLARSRFPGCYLFSRSCGALVGGDLAVALTPKDTSLSPYVLYRGKRTEYAVHGFLSGVAFQVTY